MTISIKTEGEKSDGTLAFSLLIKGTINKTAVKLSFEQFNKWALETVWMLIRLKFLPTPYFL